LQQKRCKCYSLGVIRENIEGAVREALAQLGATELVFAVERPGSMDHGDFATNAALAAAKLLKKNPREVASRLAEKLQGKIEGVESVDVAGAGFINFFVSQTAITKEVLAAAQTPEWGSNDLYKGKTIMVEYTQPNPFKPFHIGHLMSNTIGEAVALTLERSGAEVVRANYQGDVGPHVAKALFVLLRDGKDRPTIQEIGAAYVAGNKLYEDDSEAKDEIDAINKKVYDRSDERINVLYDWGRKVSLEHFEELYHMLGTKFDYYFFESETAPVGLKVVRAHPEIFEESDGATVFKGENYGLHTRVFITSQGLPTYETKEIGLAKSKQEKTPFDISVTITASEQNAYFKVVFKAMELLFPELAGKLRHVSHGMMRFATGKMSSRRGNVITGESLLMDLKEDAREKMKDRELEDTEVIAEQVAVGAIKYSVLKQRSGKDIIFDPEKSLSLEGDSGPYLQYAHTRALSLLREAKKAKIEDSRDSYFSGTGVLESDMLSGAPAPHSRSVLERVLLHYPDAFRVLQRA
jgi:arginyl-tRNA synthetase